MAGKVFKYKCVTKHYYGLNRNIRRYIAYLYTNSVIPIGTFINTFKFTGLFFIIVIKELIVPVS